MILAELATGSRVDGNLVHVSLIKSKKSRYSEPTIPPLKYTT
jgi:hypothetical protein